MRTRELREKSVDELIRLREEIETEYRKQKGNNERGMSYDQTWHPDFREMRKTVARINTILEERK